MQETLQSLKPTTKSLIIDVVDAVGIDVADWRAKGAADPSYCYHWAFADEGRNRILFCLWYDDCLIGDDGVYQSWNFRTYVRELEANGGPKAGRAREVDLLLQDAWRKQLSVRVAIVDETARRKANKKEGEPSEAAFRELDSEPWHLTHYDWTTGDCTITRGTAARAYADKSSSELLIDERQAEDDFLNGGSSNGSDDLLEDVLTQAARKDIPETTRDALVKARIGQGSFRSALVKVWNGQCAASSCSELSVLRASHIKPWRSSTDFERLDPANGLLLTANLDALFDQGFITFADGGRMLLARELGRKALLDLGLPMQLRQPLSEHQQRYLKFHREERFRGN